MTITRTTRDIEEEIRWEDAAAKSQVTGTKSESLQLLKTGTRIPPRNWYELKGIFNTFSALLYMLFGYVRPLYEQILHLWRVLNHPYLKAFKSKFTRGRCSKITWKVLEETRPFFAQRLGPDDITYKGPWIFPTADLGGLNRGCAAQQYFGFYLGCIFRRNSVYSGTFLLYPAELHFPMPPENGKRTKKNAKGMLSLPAL